jgi:hypothetical protein
MIRNILAVIAGLVISNLVNMGLIALGHSMIAPPAGADLSTMTGLKAAMPEFRPEQFIFPFLAHALGALAGAFAAALIAATHKFRISMAIGVAGLLGGIVAGVYLGAPIWFCVIDFLFAYIPMAWIGAKLGGADRS